MEIRKVVRTVTLQEKFKDPRKNESVDSKDRDIN